MDAVAAFGIVLRRLRKQAGFTQEGLGFEAGLERTFISMLELGQRQPTITTIFKLAKALDRSAKDLIGLIEAEMAAGGRKRG